MHACRRGVDAGSICAALVLIDGFHEHRLAVIEELGADAVKLGCGLGAADAMQEGWGHAFAQVVEELLHPFALRFLGLVEARLRVPEGADVGPHVAARGQRDRVAAQLLGGSAGTATDCESRRVRSSGRDYWSARAVLAPGPPNSRVRWRMTGHGIVAAACRIRS